eukprot:1906934-Pleurochrysis_carterae.AAC.1
MRHKYRARNWPPHGDASDGPLPLTPYPMRPSDEYPQPALVPGTVNTHEVRPARELDAIPHVGA